jgi:hypothetical protein
MQVTTEEINLHDEQGKHLHGPVKLKIYWSWILYPQVYDVNNEFEGIPTVNFDGLMNPAVPMKSQSNWLKCLGSKKKYIERWIKPYIAQLQHYKEFGYFPQTVVLDSSIEIESWASN